MKDLIHTTAKGGIGIGASAGVMLAQTLPSVEGWIRITAGVLGIVVATLTAINLWLSIRSKLRHRK